MRRSCHVSGRMLWYVRFQKSSLATGMLNPRLISDRINISSVYENHGEMYSSAIFVSCLQSAIHCILIERSVCIPTNWLHYSGNCISSSHRHPNAQYKLTRDRKLPPTSLRRLTLYDIVSLLEKFAALDLPDYVYNWLVNFFSGRTRYTVYYIPQRDLFWRATFYITGNVYRGMDCHGAVSFLVIESD